MRRTSTAAMVAIILWGATVLAPIGHAQQAPAQASSRLDLASLSTMLTNLGYQPKPGGERDVDIQFMRDGWTYYVAFTLSPDGTHVGLSANLGTLKDPDGVTASQWQTLLAKNWDVTPCNFEYNAPEKSLYFHLAMENRDMTPGDLRNNIDFFVQNIHDTHSIWDLNKK